MVRPTQSRRTLGSLCAWSPLGLLLLASTAWGYPHRGEVVSLTQPDGMVVDVVVWGDEFYVRAESPDGYALAYDPATGFIEYAASSGDGDLVASGLAYRGPLPSYSVNGATNPQALGIPKGLRRSPGRVAAIARENRERIHPELGVARTRSTGAGQATVELKRTSPYRVAPEGTVTGLVVVVDFSDRPADIDKTELEGAFNGDSYGDSWHGSIRNWSEIISGGVTSVQHNVLGYYRAANPTSYYDKGAEWDYGTSDELYREVYAYIDETLDLTSLAVDGELPSLALAYTGDIIAPVWASGLWPHGGCTDYRYRTSEGVTISRCYMTNLGSRTPLDLETHRHELGHSFFDWPDTYDYDDDSKSGGGFATETDWPCAPFRTWAGWLQAIDVTEATGLYSLTANGDGCLRYNNSRNREEYFIAEYMKREGYRTSSPDEGLLIWHVEESGDNSYQDMTESRHYMLSVEQADGRFDLERNIDSGSGDLFHAGDKDRFDETTTPNSNWWDDSTSGLKICDISGIEGDTMTVNVGCVAVGGTSGQGGSGEGGSGEGGSGEGGAASGGAASGGTGEGGRFVGAGGAGVGGDRDLGEGGRIVFGFGGSGVGGRTVIATGGSGVGGLVGLGGQLAGVGGRGLGGATTLGTGGAVVTGSGGATTAPAGVGGAVASLGGAVGAGGGAAGAAGAVPAPEDKTSGGDDGGCGCRVAGQSRAPGAGVLFGLLGVLLLRRRRAS